MTDSAITKLSVLAGQRFACIKIAGRANFNSSLDFRTVMTELQAKGFICFIIDLSDCLLMDSTFLGVLAGLGLKMRPSGDDSAIARITLLNPNDRITELLENLGVLQLFNITNGPFAVPETLRVCAAEATQASREEITRACLEAHETLMALNPENISRFKDVAKFLAEDLAKLRK